MPQETTLGKTGYLLCDRSGNVRTILLATSMHMRSRNGPCRVTRYVRSLSRSPKRRPNSGGQAMQ